MNQNLNKYTYSIEESKGLKVFKLLSTVGQCVGLIQFEETIGRSGDTIIRIPKLGTSNGGDELQKIQGLEEINNPDEKIPGLLYVMFTVFITFIKSEPFGDFWIRIENPLLTLNHVYRKLYLELKRIGLVEDGVTNNDIVIMKC